MNLLKLLGKKYSLSCLMSVMLANLAGCSDGKEAVKVTPEDICLAQSQLACDFIHSCCSQEEQDGLTVQSMLALQGLDCDQPTNSTMYKDCLAMVSDAVKNDRSEINADAFAPCKTAFTTYAQSCPKVGSAIGSGMLKMLRENCQDIIVGKVAEGGSCYSYYQEFLDECRPGLYCNFYKGDIEAHRPGTCAKLVQTGGDCSQANSFWCPKDSVETTCRNPVACGVGNTCVPNGSGSICAPTSGKDGPCYDSPNDCLPGFYCDPVQKKCNAQLKDSAACEKSYSIMVYQCENLCGGDGLCYSICDGK